MEHGFTPTIMAILENDFGESAKDVFQSSPLLQYLNIKTRSAARGSKSRGSFANHYAVYVLVEDYIVKGFSKRAKYTDYEGARYTELLERQRKLPFGQKLQNHALNSRMNEEFKKYFPACSFIPILRDLSSNRYWINENLLVVEVARKKHRIAESVIKIIDAYGTAKQGAFQGFLETCEKLQRLGRDEPVDIQDFIRKLVQPNVDARVFEIVSFAILKHYYSEQVIFWGFSVDDLNEESLVLYKMGRTNANDGGIDFVMRPLGRFFQVTETMDVRKYFLDIDKVQRYPVTFVVKSVLPIDELKARMRDQAHEAYGVEAIVDRYMNCVEEVITIPVLLNCFDEVVRRGKLSDVLNEIALYSKVEFHHREIEES